MDAIEDKLNDELNMQLIIQSGLFFLIKNDLTAV